MKTIHDPQSPNSAAATLPALGSIHPPSSSSPEPVPENSVKFRDIPSNSTAFSAQDVDHERYRRKPVRGTFTGTLSSEQRLQLIEWLADHTYDEVIELVAAQPPEGFGVKVGKTTLCRFHKANFEEIERIRGAHIATRSLEMLDRPDGHDYRDMLRDSFSQLLLERLWELLSRPVQSADELKKLTVIAEKMKTLNRDQEMVEQLRAEKNAAEMSQLLAALQTRGARIKK